MQPFLVVPVCKPDSVLCKLQNAYHLSILPTPPGLSGESGTSSSNRDMHGISTRRVYLPAGYPDRTCALTARFHPYPGGKPIRAVYFL